ncbi:D-glycerate dehydrogenase [Geosporobacter ferrireducens]|uniref:D-glycerate dehydrogenase n=2 Tax=Geosporobacter ferrireducens TaxID=1424294 RepID=A0A1D8GQJ3_9FIRM|nr:D-glycerate dehydrogenase [Geosporobacter ferrireducens]MTI57624.1 D-glycerate dehydrogenase [Geosporobacter ferrireducens]
MLASFFIVKSNPSEDLESKEEFLRNIEGITALVTDSRVKVDEEVMNAAGPQLRVISNYAAGFNNIDVAAATKKGIAVTNTPGAVNNATADIAWALMFGIARRVAEGDRLIRTGEPWNWSPSFFLGRDFTGKTLGIIGAGRIGMSMAKRACGFDMEIIYADGRVNEQLEKELGAKRVDLETLLKEADYISIHTPLTPETRHLISEKEFAMMKPTSILINTSRGPVVDEQALVEALKTRTIWGAGLDVFENEPYVNQELFKLDNVVMTPHIGTATPDARRDMAIMAAQNILDIMEGKTPVGIVNREVLNR